MTDDGAGGAELVKTRLLFFASVAAATADAVGSSASLLDAEPEQIGACLLGDAGAALMRLVAAAIAE